jgi:hypothetical protein
LHLPRPGPKGGPPKDTKSLSKDALRGRILKEVVYRFNHESMDADERLELRERILRLRRKAETTAGRA